VTHPCWARQHLADLSDGGLISVAADRQSPVRLEIVVAVWMIAASIVPIITTGISSGGARAWLAMDFTPFDRDQSASPSRSYVRCMLVRSRRDLPANSNARGIPERSGRVLTINADGALAPASRSRGRRRNQVGRIVVSELPGWVVLLRSPSAFRDW
jgi:hypothetical protein